MLVGCAFMHDGNFRSYRQCANLARILAPADPSVIAFNIEALVRYSRTPEALALVTQYEPLAKQHAYLSKAISNYYRATGQSAEANKYLQQAIKLDPARPAPYTVLARSTSDQTEAAEAFKKAASLSPPGSYHREYWLWSAEVADAKAKNRDLNSEHLDRAAKLKPDEPSWMSAAAFLRLRQQKPEETLELFTKAAQTPRFSLKAVEQFAVYCAFLPGQELNPTAEKAADIIVQKNPDLPDAYMCHAHVKNAIAKYSEGEKDFLSAIKLAPHSSQPYDCLKDYPFYHGGKKNEWLAKEWIRNCPDVPDAWLFAGKTDIESQRWSDALEKYTQAEPRLHRTGRTPEKNPMTYVRYFSGMATANYKLGNYSEAVRFAKQFNAYRPRAEEFIRIRLDKIDFAKLGKGSKAEMAAEHAAVADALYERGQTDDCIHEYRKAIALSDNPAWHHGLLKAYMDKGDYAGAAGEDIVVAQDTVTKDIPSALDKFRKTFTH